MSQITLWGVEFKSNENFNINNRTFSGNSGINDIESDHIDILNFKDGMFNSKYCEQWGFKAVKFKSTFKDNQTFFEGILKSQDNGTLLCEGVVKNIKLEAIFTWTRKFLFWEIKNEYWFRGEEILKVK